MITGRAATWAASFLVVLIGITVFSLIPPGQQELWQRALLDAGHVPLFGLFAFVSLQTSFAFWTPAPGKWHRHYPVTLAAMAIVSAGTELLQSQAGRDVSVEDYARNLIGATVALLLTMPTELGRPGGRAARPSMRMVTLLAATALLAAAWWPLASVAAAYRGRDAGFPALFQAGEDWGEAFVSLRRAQLLPVEPREPQPAVRIRFQPAAYPAFILREPIADWSAYERLIIELAVPERHPASLEIRVDDEIHDGRYADRYQGSYPLSTGPQTLSIPLIAIRDAPATRRMDLNRIRSVTLFVDGPSAECEIDLQEIRLESSVGKR